MAVTDRWHKTRPRAGDKPCGEHRALVATGEHGKGDRWLVRWRDDTGAQRKRGFARKTDADAFDATIHSQLAAGVYIDPAAGKTTFRVYAEQWHASLTVDPVSAARYGSRLRVHAYPALGDKPMATLAKRPSLIQQWIKSLGSTLAPSTIGGVLETVASVFAAAVEDSVVAVNPCAAKSVKPPRVSRPKVVPWTLATLDAVTARLANRNTAMVYLAVGCGHRQGELLGVALDDIDFLRRIVHVRRQVRIVDRTLVYSLPKGGKQRSVPLPETVALRLSAHIAEHGTRAVTLPWTTPDGEPHTAQLLFTTSAGGALRRDTLDQPWRAARAGIADGRSNGMHVLRHTAASAWLASGVDIRTVAEYLGHADPGFTLRIYAHLMPDAADRARRAMDAFFEPSAPDVPREGSS